MKRRELILESAGWLFGYYGFEKTTVDDIANRAGISKGSVYLEFQNKEAILVAVVQQFTSRELQRVQDLVKSAEAPYLEILRKLLYGHVMSYWEIAGGQLHSPDVIASANPAIMAEVLSFQSTIFLQIAFLLEKAAVKGEIPKKKNAAEYFRMAELICYALSVLFPPYPRLKAPNPNGFNLETLQSYTNELIELVLKGVSIS